MIPEPRYVRTMPSEMPAMSDPEPRPSSAKRRICVQSMRSETEESGAAVAAPLILQPAPLPLRGEVRGRPQPAGEALEHALALVLEELRLVVAGGRLGLVLAALEARCAESLRALERPDVLRE